MQVLAVVQRMPLLFHGCHRLHCLTLCSCDAEVSAIYVLRCGEVWIEHSYLYDEVCWSSKTDQHANRRPAANNRTVTSWSRRTYETTAEAREQSIWPAIPCSLTSLSEAAGHTTRERLQLKAHARSSRRLRLEEQRQRRKAKVTTVRSCIVRQRGTQARGSRSLVRSQHELAANAAVLRLRGSASFAGTVELLSKQLKVRVAQRRCDLMKVEAMRCVSGAHTCGLSECRRHKTQLTQLDRIASEATYPVKDH